jgi:hypothetical protein
MALRIYRSVVKGEIDNRTRGKVRGSIWLYGRDDPVLLDLSGNCLPDLAGCLIQFKNPNPQRAEEEHTEVVSPKQKGVAGDMTASRKVRVFDVPLDEARRSAKADESPPEHMANSLYLEWFSEANGRVVIETADYKLTVSEPSWTMSPAEAQEQTAAAQQAMHWNKASLRRLHTIRRKRSRWTSSATKS